MKSVIIALALVLSHSDPALAQAAPSEAPSSLPPSTTDTPVLPMEVPTAPPEIGAPAEQPTAAVSPPEPAAPPIEERLSVLEANVAGQEESLSGTKAAVDRLSKLKVSGIIQGRFEYHGDSADGLNSAGKPAATNRFLVRHGFLKASYDGTNSEYLLQIDATGDGVVLKDAEATFVDTWSPLGLRLTLGQFKWPFGYEVLQGDGEREMPERAFMIRRLFPGERDRGIRLQGRYEWLRFALALVNGVRELPSGSPAQDSIYGTFDQNSVKDFVGRVGGDFGFVAFGLSGYVGRFLKTIVSTPLTPKWTDVNMDKMVTANEITFTPPTAASYLRFSRKRIGADVQLYFDVPDIGGLAVKGELIYAKDTNLLYQGTPGDSCLDITSFGGILTVVQNVGDMLGFVLRYDSFDPNFSKALDSRCTAQIAAGQGDRQDTYGGGVLFYVSQNLKTSLTYEHVAEQSVAKDNDVFTAQLQARF